MKTTIELQNLIYDSGYGERDCEISVEVEIDPITRQVTIEDEPGMWWIDRDGGSHETHYDDCHDALVIEAALEWLDKQQAKVTIEELYTAEHCITSHPGMPCWVNRIDNDKYVFSASSVEEGLKKIAKLEL